MASFGKAKKVAKNVKKALTKRIAQNEFNGTLEVWSGPRRNLDDNETTAFHYTLWCWDVILGEVNVVWNKKLCKRPYF